MWQANCGSLNCTQLWSWPRRCRNAKLQKFSTFPFWGPRSGTVEIDSSRAWDGDPFFSGCRHASRAGLISTVFLQFTAIFLQFPAIFLQVSQFCLQFLSISPLSVVSSCKPEVEGKLNSSHFFWNVSQRRSALFAILWKKFGKSWAFFLASPPISPGEYFFFQISASWARIFTWDQDFRFLLLFSDLSAYKFHIFLEFSVFPELHKSCFRFFLLEKVWTTAQKMHQFCKMKKNCENFQSPPPPTRSAFQKLQFGQFPQFFRNVCNFSARPPVLISPPPARLLGMRMDRWAA